MSDPGRAGPVMRKVDMGVEPKIWENPPIHPFVHRVFHYFHHPFWGSIIFGNTHMVGLEGFFKPWGNGGGVLPFFGEGF